MKNRKTENLKQKHKEYAELIGMENLILLSRVFGGTSIYIPKEEELLKGLKYDKIAEEFTEKNAKELARKYHLSERTIYRIAEQSK
ncbi:Mor transcription activator family protein [Lachnospiraceae bacterium 46-61]